MFESPLTPEQAKEVLQSLRKHIPALRTEVQGQAVLAAYDAFRVTMGALLSGDQAREAEARKTLDLAFDITKKISGVVSQLEDVPEAVGVTANPFKEEPSVFAENELQTRFLTELNALETIETFNEWYSTNRKDLDKVTTPSLRNPLMDSIRAKKGALLRGLSPVKKPKVPMLYRVKRPDVNEIAEFVTFPETIKHLTTFKGPAIIYSPEGMRIITRGTVPPSSTDPYHPQKRNGN